MVLDELERDAGIEQMGRNRVPEGMGGVVQIELGAASVPAEEVLDLALAERSLSSRKQRIYRLSGNAFEVSPEEVRGGREERTLGPVAALDALDDDSPPHEIHVASEQQSDLAHAQAVVVNQGEECAVASVCNRPEEGPEFGLG